MFDKARQAKRSKSGFRMHTKWTYLDVVQVMRREELDNLATEMSGSKSGSIPYLGHYKLALKKIEAELSDESRIKYKAQAMKWTDEKPPPSEQRRCVHVNLSSRRQFSKSHWASMLEKHSVRVFREFTESVYSQFGMRIVIFAGFQDRDGDPAISW
jgi:hypothetical protein